MQRGQIRLGGSIVTLLLLGGLFGAALGGRAHAAPLNQPGTDSPTFTSTASETPTDTFTPTLTFTPSATDTATLTPTITLTSTPTAPPHLVIGEFRTRGPNGAGDGFVELYNPTGAAVNISSWTVKASSGCGTAVSTLATIPASTSLLIGQHYLLAATGSSLTGADQTYTASVADNGGLALLSASGTVVDQVGMCISTLYREGSNLAPLSGNSNQSYRRKPSASTACYDIDNNTADFDLVSPSTPQNRASPQVMCAGVLTATFTFTPSRTPTRTPTPVPSVPPSTVVLNEFLPHPRSDWNSDGMLDVGDEYIELINVSTASINVKNWKLDNGVGGPSHPYTLPDMTLLPRQIALFFHADTSISLSDGGSTVRLLRADGRTADILTYPVVEAADRTWCRLPDGSGAWTFGCRPTPGRLNALPASGTPEPGSGSGTATQPDESACALADTVPAAIATAECSALGAGIWHEKGGEEFWLKSRWKWEVFIQ